jgi:hypothetical protein
LLFLTSCGQEPIAEKESSLPKFEWNNDVLASASLDPSELKKLQLAGGTGEVFVKSVSDPSVISSFVARTKPERCLPLASALFGSATLGNTLKMEQFSESAYIGGNSIYYWIFAFESPSLAAERMESLLAIADSCETFTRFKANGNGDQWDVWDEIALIDETRVLGVDDISSLSIGLVNQAIYVQWILYNPVNAPNKSDLIGNAQRLINSGEILLAKAQK